MTMLEKIRRKKGLSRNELSIMSGVSSRTIEAYEQKAKDIRKAQKNALENLADALGVKTYALTPPENISLGLRALFEELCLATNDELIARGDESGPVKADDYYCIECLTGSRWWDSNYHGHKQERYAQYFISTKDRFLEHYFAGTRYE
jgi:transcriptional regulator with XRE-family HTH domain